MASRSATGYPPFVLDCPRDCPGAERALPAPNRRGYSPRKALARKAIPADIRSLCRSYTQESIRHLAAIMRQPEYSPAARVTAATALLDRGWGRPAQVHTGEDGQGRIEVIVRHPQNACRMSTS